MLFIFLLLALPIVEIVLFIAMGDLIGFWQSIGIMIATALLGFVVLRRQPMILAQGLHIDMNSKTNPLHGALVLIAGVLLFVPGYFTDAVGFLLLFPIFRTWAIAIGAAHIMARFNSVKHAHTQRPSPTEDNTITDIDYTIEIDSDKAN